MEKNYQLTLYKMEQENVDDVLNFEPFLGNEELPEEAIQKIRKIGWSDLTEAEYEEALSSENKFFASQKLGHEPSTDEALLYYCHNSTKLHERMGIDYPAPHTKKVA